jgi:hypothetical protein
VSDRTRRAARIPFELTGQLAAFLLNIALNRFRSIPRWVEYADLEGLGEEHARIYYVTTCRRCRHTEHHLHPTAITLFEIEHAHRGDDRHPQNI